VNRRLILSLMGVLTLGGVVACAHEPEAPTPGSLNLALATPNSDDGAVLLTITGGPVDSVESAGFALYSARVDPNTLRIIVIGSLAPGTIARIRIADDRQSSRYSAAINQVAIRTSHAQRDPAGYSLTLEPPAQ
jgi:hypothetical protein